MKKSIAIIMVITAIVILLGVGLVGFVGYKAYTNNNTDNTETPTSSNVDNSTYITDIYNQNMSAVVSVVNLKEITMDQFFGNGEASTHEVQQSSGSGFVYKYEDGKYYAITNFHVVQGSDALQVVISVGEDQEPVIVDAELLGGSETNDIAVITFETSTEITPVTIGDSDDIEVGEPVVAMGSPYGVDFQGTVTSGVISGPTRVFTDANGNSLSYIQTDAAINHGNSGGPLFNAQGEVIGVNSMKISDGTTDNMAFAIPINDVMEIVADIEAAAE